MANPLNWRLSNENGVYAQSDLGHALVVLVQSYGPTSFTHIDWRDAGGKWHRIWHVDEPETVTYALLMNRQQVLFEAYCSKLQSSAAVDP